MLRQHNKLKNTNTLLYTATIQQCVFCTKKSLNEEPTLTIKIFGILLKMGTVRKNLIGICTSNPYDPAQVSNCSKCTDSEHFFYSISLWWEHISLTWSVSQSWEIWLEFSQKRAKTSSNSGSAQTYKPRQCPVLDQTCWIICESTVNHPRILESKNNTMKMKISIKVTFKSVIFIL